MVDPDSVTVTPSEATLKVSGRTTLVASVSPENASDQTIVWTSGDEAVASVTDMGIVTANAVGKTTITAETVNGKTANCIITVEEGMIPVTGITINEQDQSLVMGKSLQLTATVSPQDATN
ncbi:MAG: Ig-like domain-containing protein [Eubacterium aggregans]|uniref:Ig-like domain-containing protein n=1 Tax=Clostridia TaxID=186801 RepID=UPI002B20BF85|nr:MULTISPECIES: Ig-like domain-containing protein [Clostridia]MEA5003014.1 Ig-like domain-containing protein [Christensenella sp.]MEA5073204.1 Ig-like domain-containing protein [Eubacterium aggregans]